MNLLIIGAGMYVTGRQNNGTGTILSSIAECSKNYNIEKITIVSKSEKSKGDVDLAIDRINGILKTKIEASFIALGDNYLDSLREICSTTKFHAAIISVPDHLHFEFGKTVLEMGIHCLMVKPLTPTLKEAQELVEIQKKNNVYGAVEFHKRWDETNLYTKKGLQEGVIGDILYFTIDYSQRINIPTEVFKGWADKTNIFQYLGVHYVDLVYFLTGFLPVRLSTYGTNGILKQKGIDTYDSVHASILWQNPDDRKQEFISQYNINWIDPNITSALSDQKFKVIGTLGRIECDQKNRGVEQVTEKTGIQQINPYFCDYLPDENGELCFSGYGHKSISTFINDIANLGSQNTTVENLELSRPTFNQSLVSTAVVDAINQNLENSIIDWTEISFEI